MRFAWKVFACAMLVLVVALFAFSYALTTDAFVLALEQEKQKTLDKMHMLVTLLEASTQDFGFLSPESELERCAQELAAGQFPQLRLYAMEGTPIYPANASQNPLAEEAKRGLASDIVEQEAGYLMRASAPVQMGVRAGYVYMEQDVSAPFVLYDDMVKSVLFTSLAAILLVGAALLIICALLTRPVRLLSSVARQMAKGAYWQRASVRTRDEIGDLARDFNLMADTLEAHMRHLEEEARQREDFVTSFAHELKTPLTSMIGYADMLRGRQMGEEARFRAANYIYSEGRRLERLSLKLLELMVLNRQTFALFALDVEALEEKLAQLLEMALQEKYGVRVRITCTPGIVLAEPDLLETMLVNLADNAAKASARGQEIQVWGRPEGAAYHMGVTDFGIGIPKEELQRITEAFYMVDKSRARAQNGAGLGLALCSAIARVHHTRLAIISEEGIGTTISFSLETADGQSDGNALQSEGS